MLVAPPGMTAFSLVALARFLAIQAPNGEWKGLQARGGNLFTTLGAAAVSAGIEAVERGINLSKRFELHLDERELEVLLNIDVRHLAVIERPDVVGGSPLFANRAELLPHDRLDLAPSLNERVLQLLVTRLHVRSFPSELRSGNVIVPTLI